MTSELYRSENLVVRDVRAFCSDACVITFDWYTDTRDLNRPGFGEGYLASRGIDAIHVLTRENDWYQYAEMPNVAAKIAECVRGYRRVVTYGASMGAYAAIRFGRLAGAGAALAISPQFSIDPSVARFERRWKSDSERIVFSLERSSPAPFVETAVIAYDPFDLDLRHVEMFRRRTRVADIRLPHAGHPATGALADAHLLDDLVQDFIHDRLDVADVERRMSARADNAHTYYVRSSARATPKRAKLRLAGKAAAMAPHEFVYVCHYASLLATNGRFADAQIVLARAAILSPKHPVLLSKLMEFHKLRGDLESAIQVAQTLVSDYSETFRPALDRLTRHRRRWAPLGKFPLANFLATKMARAPTLPPDVRVTTTPSPPPFVESRQLHVKLMNSLPTGPFDVLLVGDSLAEFWPSETWAPLSLFNFGVRADKTQHTLWRLRQLPDASFDCAHAVIMLGTNNLGGGDTSAGIAAGLAAVAAEVVRLAQGAAIYVIAIPPRGRGFRFRSTERLKVHRKIAELEGFETINVDEALLLGGNPPTYEEDRIHFTAEGYRRLAAVVLRRLMARQQPSSTTAS